MEKLNLKDLNGAAVLAAYAKMDYIPMQCTWTEKAGYFGESSKRCACATWYTLGESTFKGSPVFLLEHELYGDVAAGLIVESDGKIIHDDVHDGFDNLLDLS